MKLFVQGRKDGYFSYPIPEPTEFNGFGGDMRPITDQNILGKYVYTIAFVNTGCIFTKVTIVEDVQRQYRGYIGFSIFISNKSKLPGSVVKEIIDKLSETYCKNYCPDYYLENKQEDWAIFETMANQYDSRMHNLSADDIENYQKGTGEAAYIYYSDESELQKYFDSPYQEEFRPYKQVFFVEKNLEGKSENPLNALRHDPNANLTGKIDLENPKYKLIYNQQARAGVKIEVKVNRSFRYSKSKIKRKEDLEIIWSKQFCETKVKSGKWYEIGSDFLEINDIEKTITVREIEIHKITYTFTIQTKDRFSNPIVDAEIILKGNSYLPERKAINNVIQLTAEELQNKCYVIAKKENLISSQREIKLEDTKGSISLILSEHKKVEFNVNDGKDLVFNYSIQISNKENLSKDDGVVVFIGEEIDEPWQISVSHRDYETERFDYCPAKDENPKYVILKKRVFSGQGQPSNKKKYYIKIDERKGKRSLNGSSINEYEHKYPQFKCDTKYGYKFERWESHENKPYDNYDGYYEAIFKELWYRKIPKLAWVFLFIAIVGSTAFLLIKSDGTDSNTNIVSTEISNKINSYVEGIELNLDTLKEYKRKYCDSTTVTQNDEKEKSLWEKIWIFGSNDDINSHAETFVDPEFCSKTDNAIAIRNAINQEKIDELKKVAFSIQQQNLKNAIDSIDDKYKKQIGDTLKAKKVSLMDLDQVADLIQKTQKDLREKETAIEPEKNTNIDKHNEEKIKYSQKKQKSSSNSLDKEFWDLVHSGNTKKESYSDLLETYEDKGSDIIAYDIIAYLHKICKDTASFNKFKDIPEMDRKSADTLTQIDIN